jgi:hypothetical protein
MGRIAAVGPRHDITAESGGSAGAPVTRGAAVRQAGADSVSRLDVAVAVADARPLALHPGELALKELPPPPDRPERIARDDEGGRVLREDVASTDAELFVERLGDAFVRGIGRLSAIDELAERAVDAREAHRRDDDEKSDSDRCSLMIHQPFRFPWRGFSRIAWPRDVRTM